MANLSIINRLCPLLFWNARTERWLWGAPGCVRVLLTYLVLHMFSKRGEEHPSPPGGGPARWLALAQGQQEPCCLPFGPETSSLPHLWIWAVKALVHEVWCSCTSRQCAESIGSLEMYKPRLIVYLFSSNTQFGAFLHVFVQSNALLSLPILISPTSPLSFHSCSLLFWSHLPPAP